MTLYKSLIVSLLLAFSSISFAQPATTKTITYNLCYPDNSYPLNNALLTNLMSDLPRVDGKACIQFEATFSFKYKITGANFRTEIFCDNIKLKHELTFQKFNVSNELFPITAKIEAKIDEQTGSFKHELKAGAKIGEILTPDQPQTFLVTITGVEVGQEVLTRLVEKQQYISAYYTADTQIKLAFEELSTINPDSVQYLDDYLEITRKNFAIVNRIKEKELYKHLSLGENDPLNVYERNNELNKATFDARDKLLAQSENLGEEYLRLGIDAIAQNDTVTAVSYFDKAIEVDSLLAGAYVEKTKIEFNRKKYLDVINQIRFISAKTTHHSGNREDMVSMMETIESQILNTADAENRSGHFHEALQLLDSAEYICNSIQIFVCSDMINVLKSHSWRGLLNEQIVNWFEIIASEQYSELPSVIEETFNFRKENNKWLTTNELLYVNLRLVQDTLIKVAEINRETDPEKALEALYAAREICKSYAPIKCANDLDKQFDAAFKASYKKMLEKAQLALQDSLPNRADSIQTKAMKYCVAQNFEPNALHKQIITDIAAMRYVLLMSELRLVKMADKKAVTLLDSALTIQRNYSLEEANDEKFQRTRILTDYVSMLFEKADRMLRAEQLVIAANLLGEIDWVVNHFGYILNDEQNSFYSELREILGKQACFENYQQFNIYMLAAEKFETRKDYPHAKSSYQKAEKLAKSNTKCGFDVEIVKNKITRIETVAAYQNAYARLKDYALSNEFDKAIEEYDFIHGNYTDSLLQKFEVELPDLSSIAIQLGYLPFVHHSAQVLAKRGFPNESFGLITYLYQHNFDFNLSVPAQEALGASLAKEFYISDPSEESAARYSAYVIDKKWSKPFKKAFERKWKAMQVEFED
ncbi:MAG: hypothetical protein C0599_08165 [Salinivirgaceae bacterium]|nr:MAG: hypothetical protein C0599_08165 [Salinivirgaceae bacterium]